MPVIPDPIPTVFTICCGAVAGPASASTEGEDAEFTNCCGAFAGSTPAEVEGLGAEGLVAVDWRAVAGPSAAGRDDADVAGFAGLADGKRDGIPRVQPPYGPPVAVPGGSPRDGIPRLQSPCGPP